MAIFLSRVTLKFDGWPWKIIGHLFYTTLSFVQHFKAIGIFKLELQSGNAQFGSKLVIFLSRVTLKFDVWPWKTIGHLFYYYVKICASYQIHWWSQTWVTAWKCSSRVKIGDIFVPRDLENWRVTLKNNRATLLCCFDLCASFHSQWWIQTGITVRKCPIWFKIDDFFLTVWPWNFSRVTLIFDEWPWRRTGYLLQAKSSFVHHFIAICEFKLESRSGNG